MSLLRLAAGGAILGALAAPLLAAPLPAAAQPVHVAIVVQFPGSGDVRQACVPWQPGMTGDQVLTAAGFSRAYAPNGVLDQIDGIPENPDTATAYWAYWHDTSGAWTYSMGGPAQFQPRAGSVEGWSYNGESGARSNVPPPPASYAAICAGADPTPAPLPAPPGTTSAAVHRTPTARPTPAATASAPAASSTAPATPTGGNLPPSDAATSTVAVSQTVGSLRASPVADGRRGSTAAGQAPGAPPWGTLIGGVAVLALAGAAWWWSRRRARAGPS